jgi:hypothetical protein
MRKLIIVVALLGGCAVEDAVSTTEQGVTTSNKIALNKIALNKIALNKIALNKIALNKIALNKIALNTISTQDLIDNDPELLDYLISCAFPEDVTLVGTDSHGTEIEFHGGIGLAPRWATRRLTQGEQRWISACMLARVNNAGASIFISLRGPHDALDVTTEESNEFPLQEGAFFGEIFSDPQRFYACRGADLYAGGFGSTFELRACAKPTDAGDTTVCGMTFAGDCGAFDRERACDRQTGDYYERCHDYPSKNGHWHDEGEHDRFEEAITVYVHETP